VRYRTDRVSLQADPANNADIEFPNYSPKLFMRAISIWDVVIVSTGAVPEACAEYRSIHATKGIARHAALRFCEVFGKRR
jgi:hypothetical protein